MLGVGVAADGCVIIETIVTWMTALLFLSLNTEFQLFIWCRHKFRYLINPSTSGVKGIWPNLGMFMVPCDLTIAGKVLKILPKQNTNDLHSIVKILPEHVFLLFPSLYPGLHLHWYPPSLFRHIWWHPPFLFLHWLISEKAKYFELEREICFF